MVLDKMPVLTFSGGRGAETIPLLRQLLPLLVGQGLKVALVVAGPSALLAEEELAIDLPALCRTHDLVLVAGGEATPMTRVLLLGPGEEISAAAIPWGLVVPFYADRHALLLAFIDRWLASQWLQTPLYGCVLIGGQSRRMGRPKHLIRQGGRTWLERTVATLRAVAEQVVVVGQGELPVADLPRLPDVPGMAGPLAGLAAAMRWQPWASWLLVACDLPELDVAALEWLVAARRPGVWAVIPQLRPDFVEPLLAYYDFRIQPAVEELVRRGEQRIGRLAAAEKVAILTPPAQLWSAWRNVNYEHELDPVARLTGESGEGSV